MNSNQRIELADNNSNENNNHYINNSSLDTVIKVIGVGNGGCNAVNRMIEANLFGVEFIAMNTDAQALSRSNAKTKVVLGDRVTQGLGAGTDPEKGAEAAREDMARIEEIVQGANLVFIASSFGGGTGTGASPVVAEAAKRAGALTIGVVTKPFEYEGKLKMSRAEAGISKMLNVVDSLIIIPNENLYNMIDLDTYTYEEALSVVDDILRQGVQGISDIITHTGLVNVDFADVKTMISISNGRAHLGIGIGKGDDRLHKAIKNSFENPLLDVSSIKNARGILANIVCPKDFAMKEYREASKIINNYANEEANIKIGVCHQEELKDEIIVTIVATGFDEKIGNVEEEKEIIEKKEEKINNNSINTPREEVKPFESSSINSDSSIKNSIDALKSPITKFHNFNQNNKQENIQKEDNNHTITDNNISEVKSIKENNVNFNRNIINTSVVDNNKQIQKQEKIAPSSPLTALAELEVEEKEEIENQIANTNNVKPSALFEIISPEDMKVHNDMGNKTHPIFGEPITDADLDVPAYLRRTIKARNINK